jgi:dephospho-CoA kinase
LDGDQWTAEQIGKKYVVREAALLFESGSYKKMDKIIVVTAPEPLRVKRVLVRDKQRTEEEVLKIIRNQMKEEEKVKKADFVLRNDETELLVPQVINLHQKFLMLSPA